MQQQIGGDHTSLTMASIYMAIITIDEPGRIRVKRDQHSTSSWLHQQRWVWPHVVSASISEGIAQKYTTIWMWVKHDEFHLNHLSIKNCQVWLQNHDQVLSYPHAPYFRYPRLSVQQLIREPTNDKIAHGYVIRKKKVDPTAGGISSISSM